MIYYIDITNFEIFEVGRFHSVTNCSPYITNITFNILSHLKTPIKKTNKQHFIITVASEIKKNYEKIGECNNYSL